LKRRLLKDERFLLAVIVLSAVAVRVAFLMLPRVVRWDEAAHQLIAHSLLSGRGFSELVGARDVQQGPLVSYLSLLGVWLHWPVGWATAGIAYVLFGAALPVPLFALGKALYGRRIGLLAALLAAVYPVLVAGPLYWGTMTEPPYLFFVVAGLYFTWRATESVGRGGRFARGAGWGSGIAVMLGLAYLTRPEALAYLAVMLLYIVLAGMVRGRNRRTDATTRENATAIVHGQSSIVVLSSLGIALITVAAFLVVTLPYDIYIYRVTGSWAISGKQGLAVDIAQAVTNGDAAEIDQSGAALDSTGREIMWLSLEQFNKSMTDTIRANPRQFVQHVRHNLGVMWQALFHQDLFAPWAVALAALGLFARPWTRGRLARELLLLLALAPLASILAFFVISRLLVIAIPIAFLWMAGGLDYLGEWVGASVELLLARDGGGTTGQSATTGETSHAPRTTHHAPSSPQYPIPATPISRALPLAVTVVAFLGLAGALAHSQLPVQPFWRIEAGDWLARHAAAGSPVMARDSEVALYAGLPMVAFPDAEWPQVVAYGRARGARYLVVEEQMIKDLRPQLSGLLDVDHPPPEVSLLAELPGPTASKTLIYAFEAAP